VSPRWIATGERFAWQTHARQTLAEGRAQREPKFIHWPLHFLSDCGLWRGDGKNAVEMYAQSLRAALDYGNDFGVVIEMQGMAMGLLGWPGREEEGFRLYAASCARCEELQTTALDDTVFWVGFRKRYVSPARERMGAAADKAEAEGRAMDWKRAVAYAFEMAAK
jgi:hypothetical protein